MTAKNNDNSHQPVFGSEEVRQWAHRVVEWLADSKSAINALNLFPVADSDTGNNLFDTFRAGTGAVEEAFDKNTAVNFSDAFQSFSKGLFWGAKGNSGTIMAAAFTSIGKAFGADKTLTVNNWAQAWRNGAVAAKSAVTTPAEGTVLTVLDAVANQAEADAAVGKGLPEVIRRSLEAAQRAVLKTTEQLEVLKPSGAVDAGAVVVVIVIGAFAVHYGLPKPQKMLDHVKELSQKVATAAHPQHSASLENPPTAGDGHEDQVFYEVMFHIVLSAEIADCEEQLQGLGDSLVMTPYPTQETTGNSTLPVIDWLVHIHTAEPDAVVETAQEFGEVTRVGIERLVETDVGGKSPRQHFSAALESDSR